MSQQYNLTHTVKIDEVGKIINFTCRDSAGLVDLTPYTVILLHIKKGTTLVIDDAVVSKRTQSGATLGQCYHTWTALTIPDTKGKYKFELKCTNGSDVIYFPVDENDDRTYGELIVQDALG